ncbi:MAG: SCO family protein [Wenzhouxiangellaceae bacterium]|nr:SCO family protein [Wenzhouxiangellaceae bacterium]
MSNRLTLLAIAAAFFLPVLIAVVLHSQWIDWTAEPGRAHGVLIEPVVPIGEFDVVDAAGDRLTGTDLRGRWQLILATRAPCAEDCRERLALMRQLWTSLNRHQPDVGMLFVTDGALSQEVLEFVEALDAPFRVVDGAAGATLARRLPELDRGGFYIVDPMGNIMERFAADADLNGVRKDLRRLLTWTRE